MKNGQYLMYTLAQRTIYITNVRAAQSGAFIQKVLRDYRSAQRMWHRDDAINMMNTAAQNSLCVTDHLIDLQRAVMRRGAQHRYVA